ncbi:MAG: hypothetical protein MZV70_59305 [Desulfobacterales bacterium]|nr:hypothetical protein [Desulfobacterales bacterium]
MVMLTLTRDNIDQVISLAERLQGLTDLFTFNRLALVGEGARLSLPSQERFSAFLDEYIEARRRLPVLGIKDNLIGIKYHERGSELFGGCTGYWLRRRLQLLRPPAGRRGPCLQEIPFPDRQRLSAESHRDLRF